MESNLWSMWCDVVCGVMCVMMQCCVWYYVVQCGCGCDAVVKRCAVMQFGMMNAIELRRFVRHILLIYKCFGNVFAPVVEDSLTAPLSPFVKGEG